MIKAHKVYSVTIKWHDTNDIEDVEVSVGNGIDESIDGEVAYTFAPGEWRDVVKTISKSNKYDCGDFSVIKIS
jgi:hypothetical protein